MMLRLLVVIVGLAVVGSLSGLAARWAGNLYGQNAALAVGILLFCVGMALTPSLVRLVCDRFES